MSRPRLFNWFLYVMVAVGAVVVLFSLHRLSFNDLNWRFLLLCVATLIIASRVTIKIPRVKGEITVADTLIFLTILIYGGEAAILLAAAEGFFSSLRLSKKPRVFLFNTAQMASSTFVTVWVLRFFFGPIAVLVSDGFSARYLVATCVMAFTQYIVNSTIVASYTACKTEQPVW